MLEADRSSCCIHKILFYFRTSVTSNGLVFNGLPMKFRVEVSIVVMAFL